MNLLVPTGLGRHIVNIFYLWGFQYLQNSSKDRAQNIVYSPRGGTKSPELHLMAKLLLFYLA